MKKLEAATTSVPDELDASRQQASAPSTAPGLQHTTVASSWIAPLPPPSVLRAYNEAFPGCAERIVAMAEAESAHRQQQEQFEATTDRLIVTGELRSEARGMWLAFALAIFMISVSGSLIYLGLLAWGMGLLSVELVSLVALFIYGRNARRVAPPTSQNQDPQANLPFPE